MNAALSFAFAAACLVLWGVLVFALALPTGWAHLLVAAAGVLVVHGIVKADEVRGR